MLHYDKLAKNWLAREDSSWDTDAEYLAHGIFSSYQFCDQWMRKNIRRGRSVLDYGCGNGIHSILPAKLGAHVFGVDISRESLRIARTRAKKENVEKYTTFKAMDCEKLEFPARMFDVVFDGGTFSSLALDNAVAEIARVLKPGGTLLAIETLGHNPLTNVKRSINKLLGRRTGWAVDHIFTVKDLELLRHHFSFVEARYFHLASLVAFSFLSFSFGRKLLSFLERFDTMLLRLPFLQRFAFKIVIVASRPKT